MKLIFAGTPEFAAFALDALIAAGHNIGLVLTQPDRPAGRGLRTRASPVKTLALEQRLPLLQPISLNAVEVQAQLRDINAEAMVVAAYGLILPASVLAVPARGCLNIHASLLPRWRGAAPIQRAILAGDGSSGITIMQMDAGLDTGAILFQQSLAISDEDTGQTLHDKLAVLGANCIVRVLRDQPRARAQDAAAATYAKKISKSESIIDWQADAEHVCRQIRAFNPVPGATTTLNGMTLKLWRSSPVSTAGAAPGTIMRAHAGGIEIAAGRGAVNVTELQKAGGKRLSAGAFLDGAILSPGMRLGA